MQAGMHTDQVPVQAEQTARTEGWISLDQGAAAQETTAHVAQMGGYEGAPLVYFHQVKHMWVGYADGRSGTAEEGAEADES